MRRNKERVPVLPSGAEMIACTYGVGKDDYLYVVLAFIPHGECEDSGTDQFVTWVGNSSVSYREVAEGHYMPRLDKNEEDWIQKAWDDFELRSRKLYRRAPEWFKWEADQEKAGQ